MYTVDKPMCKRCERHRVYISDSGVILDTCASCTVYLIEDENDNTVKQWWENSVNA